MLGSCCVCVSSGVQTDATTPQQWWRVVASVLAVVCKRMQQHTNNVGSCCVCVGNGVQTDATTTKNVGELLRLCWQWCANGCNNNQQCWGVVASVLAVVCKRMQQHTNNVGSCCVLVGIGVQTDPKTPNNVGTCNAS